LEKRAEQVLPVCEEDEGRGRRQGAGGAMVQTMYAHMNKFFKSHLISTY
jgi:hypothetical protein